MLSLWAEIGAGASLRPQKPSCGQPGLALGTCLPFLLLGFPWLSMNPSQEGCSRGAGWTGQRQFLGYLCCREVLKWAGGEEQAAPLPLAVIRAFSGMPDAKSGIRQFMNNAPVPCTGGCCVDLSALQGHKPACAAVARPPAGPMGGFAACG